MVEGGGVAVGFDREFIHRAGHAEGVRGELVGERFHVDAGQGSPGIPSVKFVQIEIEATADDAAAGAAAELGVNAVGVVSDGEPDLVETELTEDEGIVFKNFRKIVIAVFPRGIENDAAPVAEAEADFVFREIIPARFDRQLAVEGLAPQEEGDRFSLGIAGVAEGDNGDYERAWLSPASARSRDGNTATGKSAGGRARR